jgi:hypothetical protein
MKRREDDLDDSIAFQRMLIRDMQTTGTIRENYYWKNPDIDNRDNIGCIVRGPGIYCMDDPWTGEPLTYADVFDLHAMTMMVIAEVCERDQKQKMLTLTEKEIKSGN